MAEVPASTSGEAARSDAITETECPPHWNSKITRRETPGDADEKGRQISVKVRVCQVCTQEIPLDYKPDDDPASPDRVIEPHSHLAD